MSLVTTKLGLTKPAGIEQFNLATYNTNLDVVDANAIADAASIKKSLKILGVDNAIPTWGTVPVPATSDMQVILGSFAGATDASGYAAVNMSQSFANGYFVVGLLNGDTASQSNITIGLSTGVFTNLANRFYVRAVTANTGTPLNVLTFRTNYIVVGW